MNPNLCTVCGCYGAVTRPLLHRFLHRQLAKKGTP